jgi:hypothetical protein
MVVLVQLETSAPVVFFRHFFPNRYSSYQPMKDDTEGVSTLICISTKFDSVHFMHAKDGSGMYSCYVSINNGWLSNGYTEDVAPPYHVAMTRCKSKLTLLHGHKSPPLKSVERMISSDTLTTYIWRVREVERWAGFERSWRKREDVQCYRFCRWLHLSHIHTQKLWTLSM